MNITKSAPLPERPCEQLTCCEKNGSVQGNYINRVEKRRNYLITGKTKATRYGGPSTLIARYPQRKRADYYAVITSGWQCDQCAGLLVGYSCSLALWRNRAVSACFLASSASLATSSGERSSDALSILARPSLTVIFLGSSIITCASLWLLLIKAVTEQSVTEKKFRWGYSCSLTSPFRDVFQVCGPIFVRLYSLRNFSRANAHGANLSCSCSLTAFLRCFFLDEDNFFNDLSVIVYTCNPVRHSSSLHGASDGYSCSLAFRRCSYFNLRPQASKTHAEKLALGLVNFSCSTLASIPSISSCGNRMFFFADLLFVFPLDIGTPHLNGFDGRTQYSKKSEKLSIDMCAHMILICAHSLDCIAQIKQRPAVLATHAGRLTTNDSNNIEVAMLNHTTHPQGRDSHNLNKYIWRFIALSTAQPRVITIEATSEQEARQQSPDGCVMVFTARIRQGVCHD